MRLIEEKILACIGRQHSGMISAATFLIAAALTIAIASQGIAQGAPPCCTLEGSGGWSAADKLNEIGSNSIDSTQTKSANILQIPDMNKRKIPEHSADNGPFSAVSGKQVEAQINARANLSEIKNSDVILDVDPQPQGSIKGAIQIDYREFLDGSNRPRSMSELSKILGDKGISRSDSVAVYSENPSAATYVFLILDLLGQGNVRLLDSSIDITASAEESVESAPAVKPKTKYIPSPKTDIIASYDYVKRKGVQVVDARPSRGYSVGALVGSKNIPYDTVLDGERIKDQAQLGSLFADLSKDKPLVVYSNDGIKASLLWYAMKLEGYNPHLYAGDNWAKYLLNNDEVAGRSQSDHESATPTIGSGGSVVPGSSSGSKSKCH